MKKSTWTLGVPLAAVTAGTIYLSNKLFNIAFKRVSQVPETSAEKQQYAQQYYDYVDWFRAIPKQTWYLHQGDATKQMVASYIPNPKTTTQTVIISHGYKGNRETMANFAKMFYDMGFNVLLPDDRGHGDSAGEYISFGWLDRLDYLDWIDQVIHTVGDSAKILLFGVSMGGATVEMLSGEHLPTQVKAIIADCGYSSIKQELVYLLDKQYHLPEYPIEPLVSTINRTRLGYYLGDVSSTEQLSKNTRPILFIHGSQDTYVPVSMAYENYRATKAPKQLWIVKDATHAESFWAHPQKYQQRVDHFLKTYFY